MTTKETLLQKATELFANEGYNGVSVRKLARAAGITEGSIYNHFSSKKEILDEILDHHAEDLRRQIPSSQMLIDAYDKDNWKPAWVNRIKVMEQQTPSDMNLDILKLLTSEQYKNAKAGNIILKYYIELPVQITYELFEHLRNRGDELPGDPMTLARTYQYPLYGLTQEYAVQLSLGNDTSQVINKMKDHINYFWKTIMGKSFEF